MKIREIISQHRRDFRAVYECESYGHTKEGSGYDDYNFHQSVIPNMACDKCGANIECGVLCVQEELHESP